jgi:hypothetical protein
MGRCEMRAHGIELFELALELVCQVEQLVRLQ